MTFVDVDDDFADARQVSVSACHEAVLVNGHRVLLLDDRGWSSSLGAAWAVKEAPDGDGWREGTPDIWAMTSVEDIVDTARVVVGPDEPFGGRSHEDMEADHW